MPRRQIRRWKKRCCQLFGTNADHFFEPGVSRLWRRSITGSQSSVRAVNDTTGIGQSLHGGNPAVHRFRCSRWRIGFLGGQRNCRRQCRDGQHLVEWIVQGSRGGSLGDDHYFGDRGGEYSCRAHGDSNDHRLRSADDFALTRDDSATGDAAVSGFRSGERQCDLVGESIRGR